jgi:sugar/nucleoside kinase (ribokinase family)
VGAAGRRDIVVAGQSVTDLAVEADEVRTSDHLVQFRLNHDTYRIPIEEPAVAWGAKVTAREPLTRARLPGGARLERGGGALNVAVKLGAMQASDRVPRPIRFIDLANPPDGLETELRAARVDYLSLGLCPPALNLILTQRGGPANRIVVRSPTAISGDFNGQWIRALRLFEQRPDLLLINSPKSAPVVRALAEAGQRSGARQCSVLTPSLVPRDRLDLLVTRDEISMANLTEFAELAGSLGIASPAEEQHAEVAEVARAMTRFSRQVTTGHLVVTLGARGCVVGDVDTGSLWHVELRPEARWHVRERVAGHRSCINRSGDHFFAGFILAHAQASAGTGGPRRLARAAVQASLEVVRGYGLSQATEDWFSIGRIGGRFPATLPTQLTEMNAAA